MAFSSKSVHASACDHEFAPLDEDQTLLLRSFLETSRLYQISAPAEVLVWIAYETGRRSEDFYDVLLTLSQSPYARNILQSLTSLSPTQRLKKFDRIQTVLDEKGVDRFFQEFFQKNISPEQLIANWWIEKNKESPSHWMDTVKAIEKYLRRNRLNWFETSNGFFLDSQSFQAWGANWREKLPRPLRWAKRITDLGFRIHYGLENNAASLDSFTLKLVLPLEALVSEDIVGLEAHELWHLKDHLEAFDSRYRERAIKRDRPIELSFHFRPHHRWFKKQKRSLERAYWGFHTVGEVIGYYVICRKMLELMRKASSVPQKKMIYEALLENAKEVQRFYQFDWKLLKKLASLKPRKNHEWGVEETTRNLEYYSLDTTEFEVEYSGNAALARYGADGRGSEQDYEMLRDTATKWLARLHRYEYFLKNRILREAKELLGE